MIKQKKASFFSIISAVFLVVVLVTAFVVLQGKKNKYASIGERQYGVIETYQSAEKALFYIDQSAKYSAEETAYNIALGFSSPSCGKHFGYDIWIDPDKKRCFPEKTDIEQEFKQTFHRILDNYISNYIEAKIPSDNYEFNLKGNLAILGKAKDKLVLVIGEGSLENFEMRQEEIQASSEKTSVKPQEDKSLVSIKDVSCSGSCLLNQEAYLKLVEANKKAKSEGFELYVYSSYRDLEYQKALWEGKTPENYAAKYPDESIRRKYVCYPYGDDVYQRCPHLTGGAIDVRIKGKAKSQMSAEDWNKLSQVLYSTGWVRYANEEWHFEYKTDRWARAKEQNVNVIV